MATLQEQRQAMEDPNLRTRVRQALIVSAQKIMDEVATVPNHGIRLAWAKKTLAAPDALVDEMLGYVIAKNSAATLVAIIAASDATVQQNIDASVDLFA